MNSFPRDRREDIPFRWRAFAGIEAMGAIAGVPHDQLFQSADAVTDAYARGKPMLQEMFGPDVAITGPQMAYIAYGHVNCLGSPLRYPEDSDIACEPIYDSLADAVAALRRAQDMDFTKHGRFPFYLELWNALKRRFPDDTIPFGGFKPGGPLTDAWLLRGTGLLMDLYDDPPLAKEYIGLVTASIVRFRALIARLDGKPEFSESHAYNADDVASFLSPAQWPEFVMPYHEQYFRGLTSGRRLAHIEGLTPGHLRFIDELGLSFFDPSVSPKLTPALVRDGCAAPFMWRLTDMDHASLSCEETERWVFEAAADGATEVATQVWRVTCVPERAEKVLAFIRAAKRVQELLESGVPRAELRNHAS